MKNIKRLMALLMAVCMMLSVVACGSDEAEEDATYTYKGTTSSISTWNPTDWLYSSEAEIIGYTTSPLYAFNMNEDKTGYVIEPEVATEAPEDVTAEYAGNETYGVPADATEGYAYRVEIRDDFCWADGTKITADDYLYTVEQFINPEMQNYRASNFTYGSGALANAQDYLDGVEGVTFDQVGIIKNDEHTITFVYANPVSQFNFYYNHGSMYLLNEKLYEANKTDADGLIKSSYNTAADKATSCGPYIVTEYQEDKIIKLAKNEKWYGWDDESKEGQYQTTNIELQDIEEHTTVVNMFLQGNLDTLTLSVDDMEKYGTSDYVYYSPNSYTYSFSINSDFDALKALDDEGEEGRNRTILSYKDFRKAISLCMDRSDYTASTTAGSVPGYGLLNDIYMSDPENMVRYRDTEQAQQVLKDVYGVSDLADLTGYDKEEASKLFVAAYEQCLADGNISETDTIYIEYHTFDSEAISHKMVDYLQQSVEAAVEGTVLEGRIEFKLLEDPDLYYNQPNGLVDIAQTSWGGSDLDPFSLMECYVDPGYKGEYGYDPMTDEITINVNGEDLTMSTNAWHVELMYGAYATADMDTRLDILAALEKAVLLQYDAIPLYAQTACVLYSHRVVLGSSEFINSVLGFGGIQYMTYTMNDAEWAEYCAENNNQLTY